MKNRTEIIDFLEIPNVGPATIRYLDILGINKPSELIGRDPYLMFKELCAISGKRIDPCLADVFISAVRFMEGAPPRKWWEYSKERKRNLSIILLIWFVVFTGFSQVPSVFATPVEEKFLQAGLVDISEIDATIQVDLVNSDPEKNFFRENYYGGLKRAYLREPVAIKLSAAQKILKIYHPDYSLKILDAARPRSVSRAMYKKMKGTRFEKYVANPAKGSMHNYGIAVDITIVDGDGEELDMGVTPFNKNKLQIYWQYAQMKLGKKLTSRQKSNRELLSRVMREAGFFPLGHEWWHFNGMEKEKAREKFKIIE